MYKHLYLGATQQLANAAAVLEATKKLYPVVTSSGYFPKPGAPGAPAPGFDPGADFWTYEGYPASTFQSEGNAVPEMTVYDQIKGGGVVLVDKQSAQDVIAGVGPLRYAVSQDELFAQIYAQPGSGSTWARLTTSVGTETAPKKKDSTTPILVAAAAGIGGALIGGPAVGVAAAAAGYLVTS